MIKIKLLHYFKIHCYNWKNSVTENYWWFSYFYTSWVSAIFNSLRGAMLRLWRIHKIKLTFICLISNFLKHKRLVSEFWQRCIFKYEASWRSRSSNLRKTTYYAFFRISISQCYCRIVYDGWRLHYQIWFTVHHQL